MATDRDDLKDPNVARDSIHTGWQLIAGVAVICLTLVAIIYIFWG